MANPEPIEGMTTIRSAFAAGETVERFEGAVRARGMTLFARIDHAAGAAAAGLELRPTTVVIFGDARVGTKLMQATQSVGIELPLKVLVWEDAIDQTWLSYDEPEWLARRHGIDAPAVASGMGTALRELAHQAATR
jgi:uncharacterized protein (DUF302 family)